MLFAVSFFLRAASFSIGVAAVFLFYGAAFAAGRDTYVSVLAAGRKNYGTGVRERQVVVSEDAPLVRLFHHVDGRSVTTFRVVRENGGDPDAPPLAKAERPSAGTLFRRGARDGNFLDGVRSAPSVGTNVFCKSADNGRKECSAPAAGLT